MYAVDLDVVQVAVTALGILVYGFGFYFLHRQLRRSSHSDIYALGIATKQAMLEYPGLRQALFGKSTRQIEDEFELNRLLTLADMYCLYLEQIAIYSGDLGGEKQAWIRYVKDVHAKSPVIREYIQANRYADRLYEVIGTPYSGTSPGSAARPDPSS